MSLTPEITPTFPRLAGESRTWGEAVDLYLTAGVDSENTRRAYGFALRHAFAVLRVTTIDEITPYMLAAYRESVISQVLAPSTKRQQIAATRSFLRWARAFGLHTLNPSVMDIALRLPKAKTLVPYTILTEDEIASLFRSVKQSRTRALLLVMLGAGLRVSEVSSLDVRDLCPGEPPYIVVRQGKGDHSRAVPVRPQVMEALRSVAAGRAGTEPLFRTTQGPPGRLQVSGIRERIATAGRQAGIQRTVTPHMLRHTYAIRALLHGNGNVMAISKLLGHKQLSTTQRYLDHLEMPDLLASVPALPSADSDE